MESRNQDGIEFSNIRPISEKITDLKKVDYEELFLDLVWRISEVKKVELELDYKYDDLRHYAFIGNQTLTNQTLMNILSPSLLYIDFVNNTYISNNFYSKIGYHAPNIKGINLIGTEVDDDT